MARGVDTRVRRSRIARRGRLVMANGVVAPERKNNPTTEPAMTRQRRKTAFKTTNDTISKYRTTAGASVDATNRYPVTCSRTLPLATIPVTVKSDAPANQIAPKMATGTPNTVLNRLMYTWEQLNVALTSQKLV